MSDTDKIPLLMLHRALELREQEIDRRLQVHGGEPLARWQAARTPYDVRRVYGPCDYLLNEYAALAEIVTKREQRELDEIWAARNFSLSKYLADLTAAWSRLEGLL